MFGLVDLVAWRPDNPDDWWLRYDDATPILGVRELRIAAYFRSPITLYLTPEAWCRAADDGHHGVVILNWDAPLDELFAGVGRVECDDPEHSARLVKALRAWEPTVTGTGRRTRHAA